MAPSKTSRMRLAASLLEEEPVFSPRFTKNTEMAAMLKMSRTVSNGGPSRFSHSTGPKPICLATSIVSRTRPDDATSRITAHLIQGKRRSVLERSGK